MPARDKSDSQDLLLRALDRLDKEGFPPKALASTMLDLWWHSGTGLNSSLEARGESRCILRLRARVCLLRGLVVLVILEQPIRMGIYMSNEAKRNKHECTPH